MSDDLDLQLRAWRKATLIIGACSPLLWLPACAAVFAFWVSDIGTPYALTPMQAFRCVAAPAIFMLTVSLFSLLASGVLHLCIKRER